MAVNYTLTINDPTNALINNTSLVAQDIDYVMMYLSQYIVFQAPLQLQIDVKPSSDNPSQTDGLLPSIVPFIFAGPQQATPAAIIKGQTGADPNGNAPEAGFTIYLGNDGTVKNYGQPVWFDPNPQVGTIPALPNGSADFISIAMHEILHGLGFAAWAEVNAPWNQHTILENGIWYYTSPAINSLLGGPLPLDGNARPGIAGDHIGNTFITYQPVTSDSMYMWGNYANNRWDIGQVDLLILQDLGWEVQNYLGLPLVDPLDQFDRFGTTGNDKILATRLSSILSADAGNDTIVLPGTPHNGNYFVDGGTGTDTLEIARLSTQFKIVNYGSDFLLQSIDGSDGVSLLHAVEAIQFIDKSIALAAPISVTAAATIQNDYLGIT